MHCVYVAGCKGYMSSSKADMSQLAAELYAIVCVECRDASVDLVSMVNDLLTDTHTKVCTCSIQGLCYVLYC